MLQPMRIEVKTSSGMSLIEASRWSAEGAAKVVPATTGATEAPPAAE